MQFKIWSNEFSLSQESIENANKKETIHEKNDGAKNPWDQYEKVSYVESIYE